MTGNYVIGIYGIYAIVSLLLTGVLARTLFRSGHVFLEGVFETKEMAAAINRLLVVGFYMLNLGYALLIFRTSEAETAVQATENLVTKIGVLLVSLGVIHFMNLAVFGKLRARNRYNNMLPTPPKTFVAAPAWEKTNTPQPPPPRPAVPQATA